jgi:hypothetical protein
MKRGINYNNYQYNLFFFQKDDITIRFWFLHLHHILELSFLSFVYLFTLRSFWKVLEGFGTFWKMAGEFEFEIKIELNLN